MPIVPSTYTINGLFRNGHFSTIYSAKLRKSPKLTQHRERLALNDGDFLDLDFSYAPNGSNSIAILLHGLEGNAQRTYIKGQGKMLVANGWDVCAVNYRGCSGAPNIHYHSYNAGKTDDLEEVISYILQKNTYAEIALVGFSLGGNLLLKYLGERDLVPKEVRLAVAVSSPLSLKGSLISLSKPHNWVYRTSFLHDLRRKFREKSKRFPEQVTEFSNRKITTLLDFDNIYTAPAHGFKDAYEYYQKNSSLQFLPKIKIQTLILNAENDSFLSPDCYPLELASHSKNIYLEMPKYGGHVGFFKPGDTYYSEERTVAFLNNKKQF